MEENIMKVTCPHCNNEIAIETPEVIRRGQLAGIPIEEMTDEQLAREIINANSCLTKAVKRGADASTIAKNTERLDAAKAERAKRKPVTTSEAVEEATTETDDANVDVVAEETADVYAEEL